MQQKEIKNFTIEELKEEMEKIKVPAYRAEQVFFWLYRKGINDFKYMYNIPEALRYTLCRFFCVGSIKLKEKLKSIDGTEKFLFELSDGNFIETVLIYSGKRKTICVSTQVGCKYACAFCASGMKGFIRDLCPSEIVEQVLFLQQAFDHQTTNIVFMGIGEPLDNYENLAKAIEIMNCPQGMRIGARRFTISTCGVVPGIEKLKDIGIQVNLSLSLHATNDRLRSCLMPVNKKYSLEKVIKACEDYIKITGRDVTLEYVVIKDKNDSPEDIDTLSSIAKRLRAKINIIPYSPVPDTAFKPPSDKDLDIFKRRLLKTKRSVTVRESKGKDIQAACGQLACQK